MKLQGGCIYKSLTSSRRLINIAHFIKSWIIPLSIFNTPYIILFLCLQGKASLKKLKEIFQIEQTALPRFWKLFTLKTKMQLQIQCLIFAILPQAKFLLEAAGVLSHSLARGLRLNLIKFVSQFLQDFCPNAHSGQSFQLLKPHLSLLGANPATLQTQGQAHRERCWDGRGQQLSQPSWACSRDSGQIRNICLSKPYLSPSLQGIQSPDAPAPAQPPTGHPQLCWSHV